MYYMALLLLYIAVRPKKLCRINLGNDDLNIVTTDYVCDSVY